MGVGDGIFRLARVQASSGRRGRSGLHADAVSQRRACPRTRDDQVRQPACARDDHRVGVELAALAAGQRPAWLVSCPLWWRGHALATDWDGGRGPQVTHGAVALRRDGRIPGGGGPQRGLRSLAVLRPSSLLVLVEAARGMAGPCQKAVVEMGAPPTGLPARVERRREHRVTGVWARPESRSLATMVPTPQEAARPLGVQ